jgi:calcineurin-like phosphoesterase family protein
MSDWERRIRIDIRTNVRESLKKAIEREQMIKTLKFSSGPNQRNFVVSDTHFNHNRDFIYGARGFDNVQAHNKGLIEKINELVGPNDNLFHLGDFCLNSVEVDFENFLSQIKCQNIYFLWGNHNNPLEKIYRRAVRSDFGFAPDSMTEVYPFRYKNMIFCGSYLEVIIDGKFCVMCHYPIKEFNHMKHGSYMLCGHSHGGNPMTNKTSKEGLYLDCGWEDHRKPLLFSEIVAIMDKKERVSIGHH